MNREIKSGRKWIKRVEVFDLTWFLMPFINFSITIDAVGVFNFTILETQFIEISKYSYSKICSYI